MRPGYAASDHASFRMVTDEGAVAEIAYEEARAMLRLNLKEIAQLDGGTARLVTDKHGKMLRLESIDERTQRVTLRMAGRTRHVLLQANERLSL